MLWAKSARCLAIGYEHRGQYPERLGVILVSEISGCKLKWVILALKSKVMKRGTVTFNKRTDDLDRQARYDAVMV